MVEKRKLRTFSIQSTTGIEGPPSPEILLLCFLTSIESHTQIYSKPIIPLSFPFSQMLDFFLILVYYIPTSVPPPPRSLLTISLLPQIHPPPPLRKLQPTQGINQTQHDSLCPKPRYKPSHQAKGGHAAGGNGLHTHARVRAASLPRLGVPQELQTTQS